nr:metallothionein 1 [Amanita muscaria]
MTTPSDCTCQANCDLCGPTVTTGTRCACKKGTCNCNNCENKKHTANCECRGAADSCGCMTSDKPCTC